jgi:hypothetical protein
MTEVLSKQNEQRDARPIGRFLLPRAENKGHNQDDAYNTYNYAEIFAEQYKDILRKGASYLICASQTPDGILTVPINTPPYGEALWLEFDQSHAPDGQFIWRLTKGNEQYYLSGFKDGSRQAVMNEMNNQGAVLRRIEITDDYEIDTIQDIIEAITRNSHFRTKVKTIREQIKQDTETKRELESLSVKTPRHNKEYAAAVSRLFDAGFESGSRDVSKIRPLLD